MEENDHRLDPGDDADDAECQSEASIYQTCGEDFRDRDLNVTKAFYGISLAGMAFVGPYLPVFFKMKGITAAENGLLGGLRPLVNFWSGPLLCGLADKMQRRKLILFVCSIAYTVFMFSMWFVPADEQVGCGAAAHCFAGDNRAADNGSASNASSLTTTPTTMTKLSWESSSVTLHTGTTMSVKSGILRTTSEFQENSSTVAPSGDLPSPGHGRTLAYFAVMVFLSELAGAPMFGLIDTITLETLGHRRVGHFGRQRLWGAVGYGVANAAAGYGASLLADACGYGNYTVHFVGFVVILAISLVVALSLKDTYHRAPGGTGGGDVVAKVADIKIGRGLRLALCNARAISFLSAVFFMAIAMSVVDNFLFWFLTELCASELLLGLSVLCMCASEIPLFIVAGRTIKRFGHTAVLVFVFACYGVRFAAYSLLHNPWLVLAIEPLHGVCFALMWSCCVSYAKRIAPPRLEATLQGVLNGVFWGVGRGTGAVLGGVVYKRFGARWLFRGCAIGSFAVALLYFAAERAIRAYERRYGTVIAVHENLIEHMELNEMSEGPGDVDAKQVARPVAAVACVGRGDRTGGNGRYAATSLDAGRGVLLDDAEGLDVDVDDDDDADELGDEVRSSFL